MTRLHIHIESKEGFHVVELLQILAKQLPPDAHVRASTTDRDERSPDWPRLDVGAVSATPNGIYPHELPAAG